MEQVKAEPVAFLLTYQCGDVRMRRLFFPDAPPGASCRIEGDEITPLYATPQPAAVDGLVEALRNMVALARPHFSDEAQMIALDQAAQALAQIERKPDVE